MTDDHESGQGRQRSEVDLASLRERLASARGRDYWRSLEELADTEAFRELLHREFPHAVIEPLDAVGRRTFLKLMGASMAMAGLTACSPAAAPTDEKIVPYVRQPEEIVPGTPLFYATAMPQQGYGLGLLAESHMGRPTKVEGNPLHPASLGAADVFAQTSVLGLYDPDRAQAVTRAGVISTWSAFFGEIGAFLDLQRAGGGGRIRILTETVTSPTLAAQIRAFLAAYPGTKWHQYEPVSRDGVRQGAKLAFGEIVHTTYRLDKADVILALDSDLLTAGPGSVRYAHDFAARRRPQGPGATMNRLYAVESTPTNTGAMADHRLPLRAGEIEGFARAVAVALGVLSEAEAGPPPAPAHTPWIAAVARDLMQHRGYSLVVAGEHQPAVVHALAHAMNHALGSVGGCIIYTDPVEANPVDQMASLRELAGDMEAGAVDLLIILDANPVFTAPADLRFGERMSKVRLRVHLSLYRDETSELCHWHIPETHYLETWSDVRAYDGTVTILQPLIAPLYQGRSVHELLALLLGNPNASGHDIVRGYWQAVHKAADFDFFWRKSLHDGIVAGTALPTRPVTLSGQGWKQPADAPAAARGALEIIFRPDPTVWDGRYANNGWLQELPKPLTRTTWDNAALVSPALAQRLGLSYDIAVRGGEHGTTYVDLIELRYGGRTLRLPAWIQAGHPDGSVTVFYGYGRARAGHVGTGTGFDIYHLRTSEAPEFGPGLEVVKAAGQYPMACTQFHNTMEGRHLLRVGDVEEYRKHPAFAQEMDEPPKPGLTLYPGYSYEGYAWGMAIDLTACTGCNACVVACEAENNAPIVGKDQVMAGREMHWIRIDRYYQGDPDNPQIHQQPVPCMHCENAPCELVCPVGATQHSAEGLNDMVYNRCVGTRYCSNNCPYKVRRFNFFGYADFETESLKGLRNPNVTVRSRGVMEKCTYCVQRINAAKIEAEKQERQVKDGEILTACQQTCPTQAIVFGNINDPNSRVAKLKADPRNYAMLTELNVRPRTSYLAKIRNPNPEIEKG